MATITSLLAEHVTLRVRCVDRIFVAGWVNRLMTAGQLVRFLLDRVAPKNTIPSPAILGHIGRAYVHAIDLFALHNNLPVIRFAKGARKEDVVARHLRQAERDGRYGVVLIGVAQEKASVGAAGGTAAVTITRISSSPARPPMSTITTFTSATGSGVRRSSRPTRTRRFPCGCR